MRKLSASSISTYMSSPKKFYYSHIMGIEPLLPSMSTFSHDKLAGILWSAFVDRFYKGDVEAANTARLLLDWRDQTQGWVSERMVEKFVSMLQSWALTYYQEFDPKDGCRNGSEKLVENDRFLGYLDGLSHDLVVHEVKSTSRAKSVSEQLWKVQNSVQVKLYCVLTEATGICIEFAYKDEPYAIFRAPVIAVTTEQRQGWEQELNALADRIDSLGTDPYNYPCHPDGCCITTKNFLSMCPYQALCSDGVNELTLLGYKPKERRA